MAAAKLRNAEWVLIAFFAYIVLLIPFFQDRPRMSLQPVLVLLLVSAWLWSLALAEKTRFREAISMSRDWIPMALTLLAFRQMESFVPAQYNTSYEQAWIRWDEIVLNQWGLKKAVESLGPVIPTYLELCYLLVYGVGTFCVIVLWVKLHRASVDRFYVVLLTGTLISYALFPYFPTRPPRLAFPAVGFPVAHNVLRTFNLFLLRKATIHSGVFPSAHVSSAFSAAWAMFLILPRRSKLAWGLLIYAASVAVATIYGRYHYVADAVAGFGISLIAAGLCFVLLSHDSRKRSP
jgi:membrane-associated phospholipid phosphatase